MRVKRYLLTRTGNGASYSSTHREWNDAFMQRLLKDFWNSKSLHVTLQIDYEDGSCDVLDNINTSLEEVMKIGREEEGAA